MHAINICLKQALKLFKAGLKIRGVKSLLKLKSQPMTLIFIRNSGPLQCIDKLRSWGEPRGVQPCRCPCVVVNCLSADQEAVYFIKCNWIEIMQFRSWHIMCTLLQFNWPKCPRRGQLNFKGIRTRGGHSPAQVVGRESPFQSMPKAVNHRMCARLTR